MNSRIMSIKDIKDLSRRYVTSDAIENPFRLDRPFCNGLFSQVKTPVLTGGCPSLNRRLCQSKHGVMPVLTSDACSKLAWPC